MKNPKTYITKTIADHTFGIHPVALSIFYLLGDFELSNLTPEDAETLDVLFEIKSSPFYNGREHGICLTIGCLTSDEWLYIVFGECRNSDSIFIDSWKGKAVFNKPSVSDFTDDAYSNRKYLTFGKIYEASKMINGLISEFAPTILESINKKKALKSNEKSN